MEGESPRDWKDPAKDARPPADVVTPGKEPIADALPAEGAAFRNPPMPGTTAANLLKSPAERWLFTSPKIAPAPPVAWVGVTFSPLESWLISSGLGYLGLLAVGACAQSTPTRKMPHRDACEREKPLVEVHCCSFHPGNLINQI